MFVGHHIAFLQMCQAAGVKMTYIPEKGGVPPCSRWSRGR